MIAPRPWLEYSISLGQLIIEPRLLGAREPRMSDSVAPHANARKPKQHIFPSALRRRKEPPDSPRNHLLLFTVNFIVNPDSVVMNFGFRVVYNHHELGW